MGLFGSLKRPDFPNILEGIFIISCVIIGVNTGVSKAKKWFLNALIWDLALIVYDFIWISTHYQYIWIDNYNGGNENLIGLFSVICCAANILFKSFVGVMLAKQYFDLKKMEAENK